ncbi:hypothetical protein BH10PSE3_BH10PSE3_31330 [soil metagenome]
MVWLRSICRMAVLAVLFSAALFVRQGVAACEPTTDISATVATYKAYILANTPTRYAELAHATDIEISDVNEFGPDAGPKAGEAGRYTIVVPKSFIPLHCKLVLLTFIALEGEGSSNEIASIERIYRDCLNRRRDFYGCVRDAVDTRFTADRAEIERIAPSGESTAKSFVTDAMNALLMHEFGHIALGHALRDPLPDDELKADLFAQTNLTIAGGIPTHAFYNFSILSLLDPALSKTEESHGRFSCRASTANAVAAAVGPVPLALTRLFSAATAENSRALINMYLENVKTASISVEPGCRAQALGNLEVLSAEVTLLSRYAQRNFTEIRGLVQGGAPDQLLAELEALPIRSDEGLAIQLQLASRILRVAMYSAKDDDLRPRRFTLLIDRLLEADRSMNMPSGSYGRLIGSKAIEEFHDFPPGTPISKVVATSRPTLNRALYYHASFSEVYVLAGEVEFFDGKCQKGLSFWERAEETSTDEAQAKSSKAVRMAFQQIVETRGCVAASAEFSKFFGTEVKGWLVQ